MTGVQGSTLNLEFHVLRDSIFSASSAQKGAHMSSPATIDLAEYSYVRLASGEYSVEVSTYGGGLRVCEYGESRL